MAAACWMTWKACSIRRGIAWQGNSCFSTQFVPLILREMPRDSQADFWNSLKRWPANGHIRGRPLECCLKKRLAGVRYRAPTHMAACWAGGWIRGQWPQRLCPATEKSCPFAMIPSYSARKRLSASCTSPRSTRCSRCEFASAHPRTTWNPDSSPNSSVATSNTVRGCCETASRVFASRSS